MLLLLGPQTTMCYMPVGLISRLADGSFKLTIIGKKAPQIFSGGLFVVQLLLNLKGLAS
jgi:hypothetical protein